MSNFTSVGFTLEKMTSEEVKSKVRIELLSSLEVINNPHNLDLETALIEPVLQIYQDAIEKGKTYRLWTVLEEVPDGSGYKIFYDETEDAFGLGTKSSGNGLVCLGIYGPFITTLNCM